MSVNGGTPNYTYAWSSGQNTIAISNLAPGTYTATITDAHGCSTTYSATITEPTELDLSASTEPVIACTGGSNGAIDLTVDGGTPNYTYHWSNGPITQDQSGLITGTYTVTVTDANGCTKALAVVVPQLSDINLDVSVTNVTCNGGNNGAIDLTVSGGLPPYNYDWSNMPGTSNPEDQSNLSAGIYVVTVTDANGCTAVISATITQPTIILTVSTTPVSCNGGSNGAINLTATGGTMPYSFNWSNGSSTETQVV